ncbi:MAG: T9SS type A sorting domain-containing protein [Paludibacter sp.]|nr:T9SS type A sorting domain-containing protein [Paludibacter sp.]
MKTSTSGLIRIIALIIIAFYFITARAENLTQLSVNALPVVYTVTGGGAGCQIARVALGLSSSEVGVKYILLKNNEYHEELMGTGLALSFGNHEVGTYTVTATNSENTIVMTGNAVITEIPSISVGVEIVASANPVHNGASVIFTPVPVGGGTTPTYEWFKNSVSVGVLNTYSYIPADGDIVYAIMTSNASSCLTGNPATSNPITMSVSITSGLKDDNTKLNVYSFEKNIYVLSSETIKQINIYNAAGILVKTVNDVTETPMISMVDKPAGCYIVSIISDKNVYPRKVNLK